MNTDCFVKYSLHVKIAGVSTKKNIKNVHSKKLGEIIGEK